MADLWRSIRVERGVDVEDLIRAPRADQAYTLLVSDTFDAPAGGDHQASPASLVNLQTFGTTSLFGTASAAGFVNAQAFGTVALRGTLAAAALVNVTALGQPTVAATSSHEIDAASFANQNDFGRDVVGIVVPISTSRGVVYTDPMWVPARAVAHRLGCRGHINASTVGTPTIRAAEGRRMFEDELLLLAA